MDNMFAELQRLSIQEASNTIQDSRKQLNQIVQLFKDRPTYLEEVTVFAECVRNLEVKTLLDCDSFMVQPDVLMSEIPEELQHDSLGFCRGWDIIYSGRYVYPVKDVRGDVMGFCGYDKFEDPKYLDSTNYGYRAKRYTLWGMEKLPEYYVSKEPVFFVEGIVCALYLRQCGLQALAMLSAYASPYVQEIMKRFGARAFVVIDSDAAGSEFKKKLHYQSPTVKVIQSTVAKDVDDSRLVDSNFACELSKLSNPFYQSNLFY